MEAELHASAHRGPAAHPPASLLGLGLVPRLALAGLAAVCVWGAIAWAVSA
ncbi:hypothetical protein [Methylobacterium nodulans]|uniref:Uncharacterized protein n=1 Tax=Methylobacterium nodulans (strain LMG 21967 / CNCM I-2342 / ORS 2060) TaxID=460265 RepID=B8IPA9_METNO|nr:hypothetical protein [Methylobacterium nodulans]ACL60427.1 conserved hypothetical protein [Methylobacterium nodulans ORS 2060]